MKDEKLFSEKLFHHTIPVRDGLWDRIEAQLPPKKKRTAFPVFWFTLFATTLLSGTLMIGMLNNRIADTAITPPHQALLKPTTQSDLVLAQIETAAQEGTMANNLSQVTESDSPASDKNHNIIPNSSTKTNKIKHSNLYSNPLSPAAKGSDEVVLNNNSTVENNLYSSRAEKQSVNSSNLFSPASFLPMADINLNDKESLLLSITFVKPDPNCYKFGGVGSDYALSADIFVGPGFSPKTYEENGGEPGYADARKETENIQYAWAAGARLNLHHRSGLTARLGITYTEAGDLFDYTDSLATQSTTRIDSFFTADGTFLYAESSQVLILGTLIKKIHNTYRYLDIPLLVGYEMPIGRSLVMVNVGPVINLTSSHEGQILDPLFHPRSITNGEPGAIDVYKTSLGLSIYLGAGLVIPIADHFSGIVEPSFLYRLKPVTLGSYPLNEHRHYAGLNLGIRYHFN